MPTPDVSIVMAVKNESKFIKSSINSILNQTGLLFEIFVIDDESSDNTQFIVSTLAEAFPQIKLFNNPGRGKCSAFNHGVEMAKSEFICLFAGDDIMPPGSLASRWNIVKALPRTLPTVGLCKIRTMSENKRFDGHVIPRTPGRGALSGASPLMNRLAVEKIFPVPSCLPNEDTWMELAILHLHGWEVVHSDVIGCAWRCHSGNSINMMTSFDEFNHKITTRMQALDYFYDKYSSKLDPSSRELLSEKIKCERCRSSGDLMGILASKLNLIDKLRIISQANASMYEIRRKLYGFLSGW